MYYTIRFRHIRSEPGREHSTISLTMPNDILVTAIARALRASDELVDVSVHVEQTVDVEF